MHLWHTTVGAPPTRDRLSSLCLIEETSYVLCDHNIESPIHLFLELSSRKGIMVWK